jgi:hypothetical protein
MIVSRQTLSPLVNSFARSLMMEPTRDLGRSFLALFVGFVLVVVLSIFTDGILHAEGVYPVGQPAPDKLLVLATIYRTVFGMAGSYLTARLAPHAPMGHALIGGAIGMVLSIAGAVASWSHPERFGAHWYPVALVVLALPTAWAGGKIRTSQIR